MNHADLKKNAYRIVQRWGAAFTGADVDGIARLYAPDALMIGTAGTTVLNMPEQIRQYFEVALNTGKPRTARLDRSEALVVDDNTVIIAGFDTITATKDSQQTSTRGRVTFVIAKRDGEWMIVHLHRSPMPAT